MDFIKFELSGVRKVKIEIINRNSIKPIKIKKKLAFFKK